MDVLFNVMSTLAIKSGSIATASPNQKQVEAIADDNQIEQYNFQSRLKETADDIENGRVAPLDLAALHRKIKQPK